MVATRGRRKKNAPSHNLRPKHNRDRQNVQFSSAVLYREAEGKGILLDGQPPHVVLFARLVWVRDIRIKRYHTAIVQPVQGNIIQSFVIHRIINR